MDGGGANGDDTNRLWVFAYGSLMWRPDFPTVGRHRARLPGYHRSLCIDSVHWRGTPARPGLVLGLDRGGACVGIVYEVAAIDAEATLAALRERELVTGVYHEITAPVRLADGTRRRALAYVADRAHAQYAGRLDRAAMLARVAGSAGVGGPNADYVRQTYAHMRALGLRDADLAWLVAALDADVALESDATPRKGAAPAP